MTTLVIVTVVSLVLAAVMSTLAWRLAREERRRSDARVEALAAAIHDAPLVMRDARITADNLPLRAAAASVGLFSPATQRRSHRAAAFAVGVMIVGSIAALVVMLSGSHATAGSTAGSAPPHAVQTPDAADAPLELLALTYDRDANRLVVRGVIRNPSGGGGLTNLKAVVLLFDHDGVFLTSGRAAVDASTLAPGAETPFAVDVPAAGDVGRYRVSFRTDDRVVPHVDHRARTMAQANQP